MGGPDRRGWDAREARQQEPESPSAQLPERHLRVALLAGEVSGDELGARVCRALAARCAYLQLEGIGGAAMQAQGLRSHYPMERLAVMGLVEPLRRLPELLRLRRSLYQRLSTDTPDIVVGIDAPDFNLPLLRRLRAQGVMTVQLVSPSIWAWRPWRVRRIGAAVEEVLCLLPFEPALYHRCGIAARYVGHPLADDIPPHTSKTAALRDLGLDDLGLDAHGARNGRVIALLPGSRAAEIRYLAPLFLAAAQRVWQRDPTTTFLLPAANADRKAELEHALAAFPQLPVTLLAGKARTAMTAADVVLAASGTATLEAALLKRPLIVAYKTGALSGWLLQKLLRSEFIALPNIIAGRELVPEFIQAAATPDALAQALTQRLEERACDSTYNTALEAMRGELRCACAERVADALLARAAQAKTPTHLARQIQRGAGAR